MNNKRVGVRKWTFYLTNLWHSIQRIVFGWLTLFILSCFLFKFIWHGKNQCLWHVLKWIHPPDVRAMLSFAAFEISSLCMSQFSAWYLSSKHPHMLNGNFFLKKKYIYNSYIFDVYIILFIYHQTKNLKKTWDLGDLLS